MKKVSGNSGIRDLLVSELLRCIDKKSVVSGCGMSRQSDRLYCYVDALSRAAASCLRYCASDGRVYVFDGRVWLPLPLKREEYDSMVNYASKEVLIGSYAGFQRGELMNGERRLGRAITDGAMSSSFDVSSSYVGFQNGVWDFSNPLEPVRHGFSERLPVTEVRGYDYDEGARCPEWEAFLCNTLSESDARLLRMFFGLGVKRRTELGHSVEKMLWMVGSGGNGKSTCWSMCMEGGCSPMPVCLLCWTAMCLTD